MSAISELSTIHRVKAKTPEEKRLAAKEAGRDNKAGYLFLLPWLIGLVVIVAGPMFASLYLSFTNYSLIQAPEWIGLDNYARMLDDPRLHKSLSVTFIYVIVGVPLQLIVALAIAMLLNEGMKGLAFYRSIFYLPSMLGASVAIAVLWRQMFEVDGLVNQVLRLFGIPATTSWIADPQWALWTIILLHVWTFGSPMVIFLAGLRQIPGMYYEAASVDGQANGPNSGKSPCRCCLRSSSSIWCCRSSTRSSHSRRPTWFRTGPAVLRTRHCSTRCTCTSAGSSSSRWAMPPPWPGCWW